MTQEDYDLQADEKGYNAITLNEDGSATYIITVDQHEEIIREMKDMVENSLAGVQESYSTFTSIDYNDNYTEFVVTTSGEKLTFSEAFSVLQFYALGGKYNEFNGTPADNIHVVFIAEATGDIISERNSSDLG